MTQALVHHQDMMHAIWKNATDFTCGNPHIHRIVMRGVFPVNQTAKY
jgi:hypothetical protein